MIDYCHYVRAGKKGTKDEWAFIPSCMGGAAIGPHACTCMSIEERLKRLEDQVLPRVDELSRTVATLERFLEEQFESDGSKPIIVEFDAQAARFRETSRTMERATEMWKQDLFDKKVIQEEKARLAKGEPAKPI